IKGHLKENCWKIIGYPPSFKKKKFTPGGPTTYNAMGENLVSSNHNYGNADQETNKGTEDITANITKLYQRLKKGKMPQATNMNAPGTCTFTIEKYEQILQMLGKSTCFTVN
ncbi:hypothetical protein HAX54_028623, partial [Datura stramonium]|nr:hypothetical protein [Datura stramonium]